MRREAIGSSGVHVKPNSNCTSIRSSRVLAPTIANLKMLTPPKKEKKMLAQPCQIFLAFLFVRETENLDIYMKSFKCCKPAVPHLFGTRDQFHGRSLFHGPRGGGDGFRMIQAHNIYCALSFYYYYISSPSSSAIRSPAGGPCCK